MQYDVFYMKSHDSVFLRVRGTTLPSCGENDQVSVEIFQTNPQKCLSYC